MLTEASSFPKARVCAELRYLVPHLQTLLAAASERGKAARTMRRVNALAALTRTERLLQQLDDSESTNAPVEEPPCGDLGDLTDYDRDSDSGV